jgi:hypothetical protein
MKKLYTLIPLSVLISFCVSGVDAQINCSNVSFEMPATSSTTYSNETPNRAFDGDLTTNWSATEHTGWIMVDLQNKVTVDSLKLYVNQYYEGNTVHEIKVSEDLVNWTLVETITSFTSNNQILTVVFHPALTNVQGVMINTPSSNSWVAWFEIEVYSNLNKYSPTISQDGLVLMSSSATNNQWYLDGSPILDANSQTYTATVSGSYQVGVTYRSGCMAMSDALSVTAITTGINEIDEIQIFPNPATEFISIKGISKATIEVFNLQGQAIQVDYSAGQANQIDISKLQSGVYSMRITTSDGIYVKKLFKH